MISHVNKYYYQQIRGIGRKALLPSFVALKSLSFSAFWLQVTEIEATLGEKNREEIKKN